MSYRYTFTVFTPTYNRGKLLKRLYNSLKEQTFADFEWLIVDDGSTDDTEDIVKAYIDEKLLSIRYIKKDNGGKHTAVNLGVQEARGELFLMIDSDDLFLPDGLKGFYSEWLQVKDEKDFASVCCLCRDTKGKIIGNRFPSERLDSTSMEIREKYGVVGDKAAFTRTDIYKEFPFPEFQGERFITEAVVDDLVATKYKTRFVNKVFCIKEYQRGGLSDNSLKLRIENPKGTRYYYNQSMKIATTLKKRLRSAINYMRFSYHSKIGILSAVEKSTSKLLVLLALIPAYIMYLKDKKKI